MSKILFSKNTILIKKSFDNIDVNENTRSLRLKNVLNDNLTLLKENTDGNIEYQPSISSYSVDQTNIPATLIDFIPTLEFTDDTLSYNLDLKKYIFDDDYNNLRYELEYNDTLLSLSISNATLHIEILDDFEDYQKINLSIYDGENKLILPIQAKSKLKNTGVFKQTSNNEQISIFPNPADKYIRVLIKYNINDKEFGIKINDLNGNTIRQINNLISNNILINIEDLHPGIYILQINKEKSYSSKFYVE